MIRLPAHHMHHRRKLNLASSFRSARLRHNDGFERIDNRNILLVRRLQKLSRPITDTAHLQPTSVAARYRLLVFLHLALSPGKVLLPVFSEDTFILISLIPTVMSFVSRPCICDPLLLS